MPAEGKITLDAKQYEATLAKIQSKTAAATNSMEKGGQKAASGFSKVGTAIGHLGGAAPAAFGQIGSAVQALVMGPMGALVAVIGVITAVAVDMWDKMTLSEEELAKKNEHFATEAEKEWNKVNKQHAEDNGYMQRLDELSRKEALSNESKIEAARLIAILTARYGQLGVSIDETTGKIVGADKAMEEMAKRQQKRELDLQKRRVDAGRRQLYSTVATRAGTNYRSAKWLIEAGYGEGYGGGLQGARRGVADLLNTAKTKEGIEAYADIIKAIDKQIELEEQLQYMRETGQASANKEAADLRRKAEKTQKKTDFVENERQQVEYQTLLNAGKTKEAETLKLINDLKRQGIELTEKEARAMVQERQILASEAQYQKTKKQLEQELRVQKLLLHGKREMAREEEIVYQFFSRGNAVRGDQAEHIENLQRQLESVQLQRAQHGEYKSLYEQALRASGRGREADEFAALERARAQKGGSELTDQERASVLRMVELQRRLQNSAPFSELAIRANSLTARGGGGGKSAAQSAAERYNHEMLAKAGSTNTLLADIKREMTRLRGPTPDPAY